MAAHLRAALIRSCGRLLTADAAPIASSQHHLRRAAASSAATAPPDAVAPAPRWVFLGAPGVGKGTYSTRVAKALGVPHVAAGDLVRSEIKSGTERGNQMKATVSAGGLLPDSLVFEILEEKLGEYAAQGQHGFVLDGFPRTAAQAGALQAKLQIDLAVNLGLREEVLVEKCMGRRICSKCQKNWNVADINLPASEGKPAIVMPPLNPPTECFPLMETRSDDTEPVIRKRLEVYKAEAGPVEAFYRDQGILLDFEITAGIPETLPNLISTLSAAAGSNISLQEATA